MAERSFERTLPSLPFPLGPRDDRTIVVFRGSQRFSPPRAAPLRMHDLSLIRKLPYRRPSPDSLPTSVTWNFPRLNILLKGFESVRMNACSNIPSYYYYYYYRMNFCRFEAINSRNEISCLELKWSRLFHELEKRKERNTSKEFESSKSV